MRQRRRPHAWKSRVLPPLLVSKPAPIAPIELSYAFLLHLVDVVYQTVREDESVPSTAWARKMIVQARETYDVNEGRVMVAECTEGECPADTGWLCRYGDDDVCVSCRRKRPEWPLT